MKATSFLWRWSLVLTLPVSVLFLTWAWNTFGHWQDFWLRHPVSEGFTLQQCGILEAQHLRRRVSVMFEMTTPAAAVEASGLEPIHLFIAQSSFNELMSELPTSGFSYKNASMFYDGALRPVKARLRGDSVYHWGYRKKSWRIKTDREALFKGMRKFNLIAPRTAALLNNHLGHRLADHMGLMAPQSEVVPVSINGRFAGLHILTEQLEESTLRRAGKMPGDLYAGDLAGRERFSGIMPTLFRDAGTWTKSATNNHFPESSMAPMEELIDLLQDPTSPESQAGLSRLCDMEAFGRFSAFENIACSQHYDAAHNWRLYYDPWRNEFSPIVWDPMAWNLSWRSAFDRPIRTEVLRSPLHVALFSNADFLRARERAFVEFFSTGTDARFLREVADTLAAIEPLLDLDADMASRLRILSPDQVREGLQELHSYIVRSFDQLERVQLRGEATVQLAPLGDDSWALRISGSRQLHSLRFTFDRGLDGPVATTIRWRSDGAAAAADASGYTSQAGNRLRLAAGLLARRDVIAPTMDALASKRNRVRIQPGYYELEFTGLPTGAEVTSAIGECLDGEPLNVQFVETIKATDMGLTQQLVSDRPFALPAVWSGEVRLTGAVEIGDLVIEPGTQVLCEPNARVRIRGKLTARGTAAEPIEFRPARDGQVPWAMLALDKPGANGSRIQHCRFVGGSGWKVPLAEYSAMVSVHDVRDVTFSDCTFESSYLVDDMVHGVYSDIVFERCIFRHSLSDALDMDISRLVLDECIFEDSGNDALDLMTTSAVVVGCTFLRSGDKGISVGERSTLVLLQSTVEECVIGIQAKDDSFALMLNVDLEDNGLAFDAYKKNWRYEGGGHGHMLNSRVRGAGELLAIDKNSSLFVDGSLLSATGDQRPSSRIQFGDDVILAATAAESATFDSVTFTKMIREMSLDGLHFARFYRRVDRGSRGRSEAPIAAHRDR